MENTTQFWFVFGLFCFCMEVFFPIGVFIFLTVGAMAGFFVSLFLSLSFQTGVFLICTFVSMFLCRRHWRRIFRGAALFSDGKKDLLPHPCMGLTGRVSVAIPKNGAGEAIVGGSYWRVREASGAALAVNTTVVVVGTLEEDTLTLLVQKEN